MLVFGFATPLPSGAQTPDSPLKFEEAAIRPAAPGGGATSVYGGPGSSDPRQTAYANISLTNLLAKAYGVDSYQISGPEWRDLLDTRYDFAARIPNGATEEQFKTMLQNLLAERFRLALHHDLREFQVWELGVGENGPKFKESELVESSATPRPTLPAAAARPGVAPKIDQNGFAQIDHPGLVVWRTEDSKGLAAHMTAKAQPLSALVSNLGSLLHSLVVDKTGLQGKYDFMLEYAADGGMDGRNDSLPNIVTAVQDQLGLKLDRKKGPIDFLIVEHAENIPPGN